MTARHLRISLWLAAASAAASLVFAASALAAPTVGGFSVRPAQTNPDNPATRAYFVQSLRPGTFVRDEIVVSNSSSRPMRLRVYPVDGVTGVTSGAVYTNRGDKLRKAGRWLKADISLVRVPAHGEVLVPFVVGVPHKAKSGDHLAGIAVENTSRPKSGGRFSVTEVIRAVVGVEIKVPGPASPQLALKHLALKALPGTQIPSVIVNLGDSGLDLCKPVLAVTLSGAGVAARTVSHPLDTILPGDYIPYPVPWPRALSSGVYHASAVASGCGRRVSTSSLVTLGAALSGTTAHPGFVASEKAGGTPLWLIALVAIAGVAAGVGVTLRISRGRPHGLSPSS